MRLISTLLALLLAAGFAGEASSQSRRPVDPRGPFAKLTGQITLLGAPESEYGNGFVVGIDGCHVLTNFHVAFGKSADPQTGEIEMVDNVEVGYVVNFAFNIDSATGRFGRQLKASVVEFENYESGTSRGFLGDLALLRLETCLGEEYGQLEFDRPEPNKRVPTGRLMTVSSSRIRSTGNSEVLTEEGCRAAAGTSVTGMMLSNCEAKAGMSGSMILEEGVDKKWRVAGMTTMANSFSDGSKVSKAIYVKVINKFLDSALGGDRKWRRE